MRIISVLHCMPVASPEEGGWGEPGRPGDASPTARSRARALVGAWGEAVRSSTHVHVGAYFICHGSSLFTLFAFATAIFLTHFS